MHISFKERVDRALGLLLIVIIFPLLAEFTLVSLLVMSTTDWMYTPRDLTIMEVILLIVLLVVGAAHVFAAIWTLREYRKLKSWYLQSSAMYGMATIIMKITAVNTRVHVTMANKQVFALSRLDYGVFSLEIVEPSMKHGSYILREDDLEEVVKIPRKELTYMAAMFYDGMKDHLQRSRQQQRMNLV